MVDTGRKAPDFRLPGSDGREHTLKEFDGKYLVLYFYPRDMTPGCTIEANNFNKRLGELKRMGAVVVGVSNDPLDRHAKFTKKCGLKFLLLSDERNRAIKGYGAYGSRGIFGIGTLRSTYIVKGGRVVASFEKVNALNHADEVIEAIRVLSGRSPPPRASRVRAANGRQRPQGG
jgi:peroxiredoxin Q/BCP